MSPIVIGLVLQRSFYDAKLFIFFVIVNAYKGFIRCYKTYITKYELHLNDYRKYLDVPVIYDPQCKQLGHQYYN